MSSSPVARPLGCSSWVSEAGNIGADDGGVLGRRYLVEGDVAAYLPPPVRCSGGNPRLMVALLMSLTLWGGIVFEDVMPGRDCMWSDVSSTPSMAAGLGGVVQRGSHWLARDDG
jgi:hypothetical protein